MVGLFFLTVYLSLISAVIASSSCLAGTTTTDGDHKHPGEGVVYLNVNKAATCNGTVTGWRYCFDPDNDPQQQLIIAMYRPQLNGTYKLIPGSYRQLDEGFEESYTCRNITLQPSEYFTVQENDVVAFCEEINTRHIEIYFQTRHRSDTVSLWFAGGCSESTISHTEVPFELGSREFLLAANIEVAQNTDQSSDDDSLGGGATAAIVIVVLVVVIAAAVSAVIVVFIYYKKKNETDNSTPLDNPTYYEQPVTKHGDNQQQFPSIEAPQKQTVVLQTRHQYELQTNAEGEHNYEMEDGPQPGHVYEMSNFEQLINARDGYPYTSGYEIHEAEPHSPDNVHNYYSSIIHKAVEEDIYESLTPYQVPAEEENDLYAQINSYNIKAIPREQLKKVSHLGSGEFGTVDKRLWTNNSRVIEVAVKTLTDSANIVKFLQEAAIMAQFKHPNIVALHGVVSHGTPKMMVLELMHKGDLHHYLNTLTPNASTMVEISKILLNFSKHVALGVHYLSSIGFVHRDLAARNILVSKNNVVKIADFGMSRDLMSDDIYVSHGGMIPVRWTALEALKHKRYSTASDVWSYGCVLYEIWSLGHKPYETVELKEFVRLLNSGYRLPPPPGCPKIIYQLMMKCWHPDEMLRPAPRDVLRALIGNVDEVMEIPTEDVPVGSQAAVLGAPLNTATHLYTQLQTMYRSTTKN